jgi:site-specific DNA recombinase
VPDLLSRHKFQCGRCIVGLLAGFHLAGSLALVRLAHDVVAVENGTRFVTADLHSDTFRYAPPHHVPHGSSTQIMEGKLRNPEDSFARAQELLHQNKIRSRRRTIAPSVVQGLVTCAKCGYALSRTSTQTSARKIHYYKCIGSDSWRKLGGPVCENGRFVRQELLDQIVWAEVIRLLEEPALIQQELDRRLVAARSSDPTRKREQSLQRELTHVGKGIERLLNAYQEGLLSIEQLRERMPLLHQRQKTLRAELQSIVDQTNDRAGFLRLAGTLTAFLTRLRSAAETLSVIERQRIVRLLVKEVLVGEDTITIRHSIPIPSGPSPNGGSQPEGPNYLLCKGRDFTVARERLPTLQFRSLGERLA